MFIYPGLDSCGSERGTFPINWLITASAHNWSGTIIQSRCLAWSESELNANQVLLPINIAHTARTLSVLHPGLRCLTFITMALGPSLSCAGLQGERKGGHNSVKEASSRTTTAIRYWHQLLEAVMRAAVHCGCCESYRLWPPTWATCSHLTTFFARTSLVSLAYSLIFLTPY